jgi:hypothetical protein
LLLAADLSTVAVYALAGFATAAFTVFRPAHSALLPMLCTTPLELTSANVVRSMLAGPLVAALLLDVSSAAAVFFFTAALSVASGALLFRLSYDAPPRAPPAPLRRIVSETAEGFRALTRYPDLGLSSALAFTQALTRGFLNVFLVVVALEQLRTGAPGWVCSLRRLARVPLPARSQRRCSSPGAGWRQSRGWASRCGVCRLRCAPFFHTNPPCWR